MAVRADERRAGAGPDRLRGGRRPPGGAWWVGDPPRSLGGRARVGDTEIHIAPKIPIARLLFLLGYLTNPKAWHDQPVSFDTADDLAAAAAEALSRQVDVALRRGVLQGYVAVEEACPPFGAHPGGRPVAPALRICPARGDPLRRLHRGHHQNRILRTAVDRMLGVAGIGDTARHRLARARHRLAGSPR